MGLYDALWSNDVSRRLSKILFSLRKMYVEKIPEGKLLTFYSIDFRWHPNINDPVYWEILNMFIDKRHSSYSIHQIGLNNLFLNFNYFDLF